MEMFEKQLRPAAVLRARQKANPMKSMEMTQQTKCGEPAFGSINQIEEFQDRGVSLSAALQKRKPEQRRAHVHI